MDAHITAETSLQEGETSISRKPTCTEGLKPYVGQSFSSIHVAYTFYKNYARDCGFDIHKTTEKKDCSVYTKIKYFVCSHEGVKKNDEQNRGSRRIMISRCGCNAKLMVRCDIGGTFTVKKFIEVHNHEMAKDEGKHFLKCNRNMDSSQMEFLVNVAKVNLGATKAHKLMKKMRGEFQQMGSSYIDFKNVGRDIRNYIVDNEGELIIRKFMKIRDECDGFYFAYEIDEDELLCNLFWADPISICNYELFGDGIAVDATLPH